MTVAKANLAIYQGDDFYQAVAFTQDGAVFDVTGWTFAAQVRAGPADTATAVLATLACTIYDGPGGLIEMRIPHAQTASLTAGKAVWDLQGTDPGGLITTFLAGDVTVTAEITRP